MSKKTVAWTSASFITAIVAGVASPSNLMASPGQSTNTDQSTNTAEHILEGHYIKLLHQCGIDVNSSESMEQPTVNCDDKKIRKNNGGWRGCRRARQEEEKKNDIKKKTNQVWQKEIKKLSELSFLTDEDSRYARPPQRIQADSLEEIANSIWPNKDVEYSDINNYDDVRVAKMANPGPGFYRQNPAGNGEDPGLRVSMECSGIASAAIDAAIGFGVGDTVKIDAASAIQYEQKKHHAISVAAGRLDGRLSQATQYYVDHTIPTQEQFSVSPYLWYLYQSGVLEATEDYWIVSSLDAIVIETTDVKASQYKSRVEGGLSVQGSVSFLSGHLSSSAEWERGSRYRADSFNIEFYLFDKPKMQKLPSPEIIHMHWTESYRNFDRPGKPQIVDLQEHTDSHVSVTFGPTVPEVCSLVHVAVREQSEWSDLVDTKITSLDYDSGDHRCILHVALSLDSKALAEKSNADVRKLQDDDLLLRAQVGKADEGIEFGGRNNALSRDYSLEASVKLDPTLHPTNGTRHRHSFVNKVAQVGIDIVSDKKIKKIENHTLTCSFGGQDVEGIELGAVEAPPSPNGETDHIDVGINMTKSEFYINSCTATLISDVYTDGTKRPHKRKTTFELALPSKNEYVYIRPEDLGSLEYWIDPATPISASSEYTMTFGEEADLADIEYKNDPARRNNHLRLCLNIPEPSRTYNHYRLKRHWLKDEQKIALGL